MPLKFLLVLQRLAFALRERALMRDLFFSIEDLYYRNEHLLFV